MIKVKDPNSSQANGILEWENQPVLYKILTPQCSNAQLYYVAHNINQGSYFHKPLNMYKQWVCQLDDAKSRAEKQIQLKKITQKFELAYIC
jgi:hypothetical protein